MIVRNESDINVKSRVLVLGSVSGHADDVTDTTLDTPITTSTSATETQEESFTLQTTNNKIANQDPTEKDDLTTHQDNTPNQTPPTTNDTPDVPSANSDEVSDTELTNDSNTSPITKDSVSNDPITTDKPANQRKQARPAAANPVVLSEQAPVADVTIDDWMPNKKLQNLVLAYMQRQKLLDKNATVNDITQENIKALTELSYFPSSEADALKYEPVNGGNGTVGPDNQGNYSLEGLQYATNLKTLKLATDLNYGHRYYHMDIVDISPLAALTNLEYINLYGNRIQDVTPLANLSKVTHLLLQYNCISDFSSLNPDQYQQLSYFKQQIEVAKPVYAKDGTYTWTNTQFKLPGEPTPVPTNKWSSAAGTRWIFSTDKTSTPARYTYLIPGKPVKTADGFTWSDLPDQTAGTAEDPDGKGREIIPRLFKYYLITSINIDNPTYSTWDVYTPYSQNPVAAEDLTVVYVDADTGAEIAPVQRVAGNIDDTYDVSTPDFQLTIPGYDFKGLKAGSAPLQGLLSDLSQTVTYEYTKQTKPKPDPDPDPTPTPDPKPEPNPDPEPTPNPEPAPDSEPTSEADEVVIDSGAGAGTRSTPTNLANHDTPIPSSQAGTADNAIPLGTRQHATQAPQTDATLPQTADRRQWGLTILGLLGLSFIAVRLRKRRS